jgi:hypothetical protein
MFRAGDVLVAGLLAGSVFIYLFVKGIASVVAMKSVWDLGLGTISSILYLV